MSFKTDYGYKSARQHVRLTCLLESRGLIQSTVDDLQLVQSVGVIYRYQFQFPFSLSDR